MEPINIRTVKERQYYTITAKDESDKIIVALGDGSDYGYGGGGNLSVQYVVVEEGKYKPVGEPFDLVAGDDTITSGGLQLYNIEQITPSAGGKRKPRRSQKNKSKSKSMSRSKKGGSRKSKKGGRR